MINYPRSEPRSAEPHSWSLWSKHGQSGANGLEAGGIVVVRTAHALCPRFPDPAEVELLAVCGGASNLAPGVVGYPGAAKIDINRRTVRHSTAARI